MSEPLTLGTAGHIDHGKTALVRALTGVDGDRLPEERARGMTIALGYAPLRLAGGRTLSVIDVPGHERFVRTMVAGATGIDLFLMVVAADDGVMPQTLEHAAVLAALGVSTGVVAITKADLADPAAATAQVQELLPAVAAVVPCSSLTGTGMGELRAALAAAAASIPSRATRAAAQRRRSAAARSSPAGGEAPLLHVDRAFTVAGRGAVVTGTLWQGTLRRGDAVVLLGALGARHARVRGVQVHDADVEVAAAGRRVAVNLSGLRARDLGRGDVLSAEGEVAERLVLDCRLDLTEAEHGERVHVHHGTRAVPGRLGFLADDLWQLRLDRPLAARDGDRVVVRRASPAGTLGGGEVVDAAARRHGRREDVLAALRARRDGVPPPVAWVGDADVRRPTRPERRDRRPSAAAVALGEELRAAGSAWRAEATLDAAALRELRDAGIAVRVSGRLYGHGDAVAAAIAEVTALLERTGSASLGEVRDALGSSRKSVQALLEHLDAARITRRAPDDRRTLTADRTARTPT